MPIEIYIALLAACVAIVILTVVLISAAVYLKAKADAMEKCVSQLKGDLCELVQESRGFMTEMRQVAVRLSGPVEDVEHITSTARGWTDRADRLIDAIGTIAEPPVFFLSRQYKTVGAIMNAALKVMLSPKR